MDRTIDDAKFWETRGRAIQAFALVEQSVWNLFATLTGMELDIAGIVFFNIPNTQTFYGIIRKLIKKKHPSHLDFTNGLMGLLSQVTQDRNKIVHRAAIVVMDCVPKPGEVWESPPLSLVRQDHEPPADDSDGPITRTTMEEFMVKCDFVYRLSTCFWCFLRNPEVFLQNEDAINPGRAQTWRDIFEQAAEYPPHPDHPIRIPPSKPEGPP